MFGLDSIVLRIAGIAIAVAALFGYGYYKGYSGEKERFDAYKVKVIAAAKAQEEETQRVMKEQERITKRTEAKYEKDISTLRAVYNRLRGSTSGSAMSTIPDPATDPAQATAYYLDVAPELANQCGETTQQLINLQEWVKEQSDTK